MKKMMEVKDAGDVRQNDVRQNDTGKARENISAALKRP